jgi:Zn-dependent peptidase ImmA (M78 family)
LSVVLLNAADAVRGRIFTLAHELGHLLLRNAATKDSSATLADPDVAHEVWCNEFAGALLVPAGSIPWRPKETDPDSFDWEELRAHANRLRVSREVILRRLLAASKLSQKEYKVLRRELHARYPVKASAGGPVAQDVMVLSRLGIPFVRTVLAAYRQEKITLSDVADYLDVRVKYVPRIEQRMLSGQYEAEGAEA